MGTNSSATGQEQASLPFPLSHCGTGTVSQMGKTAFSEGAWSFADSFYNVYAARKGRNEKLFLLSCLEALRTATVTTNLAKQIWFKGKGGLKDRGGCRYIGGI